MKHVCCVLEIVDLCAEVRGLGSESSLTAYLSSPFIRPSLFSPFVLLPYSLFNNQKLISELALNWMLKNQL
jgi:hypothetical protein